MFEDSIPGVEAGRRAGMCVVWVPHPGHLELCRGREEVVLTGDTERAWDEVGETGLGLGLGQHEKPQRNDGAGRPWKSEDGWAELRTSLKGFPYERYGIHREPMGR